MNWKRFGIALALGVTLASGIEIVEEELPAQAVGFNSKVKVAVLIDKRRFYRFLPQLSNSINSYFIFKDENYEYKVFDITQLNRALTYSPYILFYPTSPQQLKQYLKEDVPVVVTEQNGTIQYYQSTNKKYIFDRRHLVFVPTLSKAMGGVQAENLYYGGIQFKKQIQLLAKMLQPVPSVAVTIPGVIPNYLLKLEQTFGGVTTSYNYPLTTTYWQLRNKNIFVNLSGTGTARFLADLTANLVTPESTSLPVRVVLGSQISYSPRLIDLTQPIGQQKLIVANSLLGTNPRILANSLLIGGNLKYNWLGYTSATLLNQIYNYRTGNSHLPLGDFGLTQFGHQIQYKTKLYQIRERGFVEVAVPTTPPKPLTPPQPISPSPAGGGASPSQSSPSPQSNQVNITIQ
jgi:hypothetical protein